MYGGRNRATKLAVKSARRIWICQRCFHAQTKLLAEQQSNTSSDPSNEPEKPLSPVEAFRLKYLQPQPQNEPPKQPLSPAERFRTSWSKFAVEQSPSQPVPEKKLTLNDLAIEYRKHGSPRQYCREVLIASNEKEEVNDIASEEPRKTLESNDVNELSRLDEMEEVTENAEIFVGENLRDYQGVLPLNGEHYKPTKFPIKQGDLIETRGYYPKVFHSLLRDFASIGIIITDRYLQSHGLAYAINPRGKLFICRVPSVIFVLPNFAPLPKVTHLDSILGTHSEQTPKRPDRIPDIPQDRIPEFNETLNDLVLHLHHFKIETDKAMKAIRQNRKSIYQLLRHHDSAKTTSVFMPDVAKMLFETKKPSYAELYATHKSLADDKVHFVPDSTKHLETATFLVRANRDVLLVSRVTNWIRESASEFEAFLDKSRKLIALSRSLPSTTMPAKLDVEVPSELYFNGNDRNIIEFVTGYVTGRRGFLPTDLYALTPLILKRTGMYPSEIVPHPNRDAARLFLTEIGVWQPSENIPSHMDAGLSMQRIYEEQTAIEIFDDASAGIRHDFGDMPVYTIDDAGAHELDDGISVEQTSEGLWLHIHIANPSAFLPPESHIASLARLRQTTLYLPDRMHPMLPIKDERFSAKGFSKDSQAMPTMTFSARLAGDRNIVEYKVRPGIVRNVKVLTYDNVDKAIFPTQSNESQAWWTPTYTHPDYVAMGKTFDDITPSIAADLKLIEQTIQTHRDWRTSQGALRMKFSGASVHVNPIPLEYEISTALQTSKTDYGALRKTKPTFVRGQAGIKVTLNNQQAKSRRLIEEMMIIAGRIAGKFAQEHDLPVAYRGLSTNIPQSLLDECRSLHITGTEELPIEVSRRLLSSAGSWMLNQSTTPQSHDLLGISAEHGGYVQVTSPMRRYMDILAHWQFESHLRSSPLPFTPEDLSGTGEHSLLQASRRVYRRIFWSRKVSQFYVASAVEQLVKSPGEIGANHLEWKGGRFRLSAFLVDEEILGTFYLIPRLVAIKELGVRGMLMLRAGERAPDQGTEFEVEIQEVNVVEGQIVVRLTR